MHIRELTPNLGQNAADKVLYAVYVDTVLRTDEDKCVLRIWEALRENVVYFSHMTKVNDARGRNLLQEPALCILYCQYSIGSVQPLRFLLLRRRKPYWYASRRRKGAPPFSHHVVCVNQFMHSFVEALESTRHEHVLHDYCIEIVTLTQSYELAIGGRIVPVINTELIPAWLLE